MATNGMYLKTRISALFTLLLVTFAQLAQAGAAPICETLFTSRVETRAELEMFSEARFGWFRKAFDTSDPVALRKLLVKELPNPEFRRSLDRWLETEFVRQGRELIDSGFSNVGEAIVGAGPHTLTLLANSSAALRAKTMVIDRLTVGSTFSGKYFQMNSAQVGNLNEIPGAIFQMKDITSKPEAPRADDFGFLIRLNYRALGIRVLVAHEFEGAKIAKSSKAAEAKSSPKVTLSLRDRKQSQSRSVQVSRLGLATGMDVQSLKYLGDISPKVKSDIELANRGEFETNTIGVLSGSSFLRVANTTLSGDLTAPRLGRRIAIIGAKHEGFTAAEAVLALIRNGSLPASTEIVHYGLQSKSAAEFLVEITPPAGTTEFKTMIQQRYMGAGLPEAIQSKVVNGKKVHVTSIRYEKGKDGERVVKVNTSLGETDSFDSVILTTGYDRAAGAWGSTLAAFEGRTEFQSVKIVSPAFTDPVGEGLIWQPNGSARLVMYSFGTNPQLAVSQYRLEGPIGNKDALFVTLPASVSLADVLAGN